MQCVLCGHECGAQISAKHLRLSHGISTAEYRAMGHPVVSEDRLTTMRKNTKPRPAPTDENTIACALCGMVCSMQVPSTHLRSAHQMTTKEYRKLGHQTLSSARLEQLRQNPVGSGTHNGGRGKFGPDHWNWKGGHIAGSGYKIVSKKGKSHLYEHRVIAAEKIGRPLEKDEVVHHIDGNRSNNDPNNLQVMKRTEHDKIKDRTREWFYTNPDTEQAARDLRNLGWSQSRIGRALRVHHATVKRWLAKS